MDPAVQQLLEQLKNAGPRPAQGMDQPPPQQQQQQYTPEQIAYLQQQQYQQQMAQQQAYQQQQQFQQTPQSSQDLMIQQMQELYQANLQALQALDQQRQMQEQQRQQEEQRKAMLDQVRAKAGDQRIVEDFQQWADKTQLTPDNMFELYKAHQAYKNPPKPVATEFPVPPPLVGLPASSDITNDLFEQGLREFK